MIDSETFTAVEDGSEGINILHYWYLFWGHKLLIISLGLLFAAPTAYFVKGMPNTYLSTSSLLIEESGRTNISNIEGLYGIDTNSRNYTTTQYEILRSRSLAERVIQALNLLENPDFVPPISIDEPTEIFSVDQAFQPESSEVILNNVLDIFGRRLSVAPVNNTSIVRISFFASDPQLAANIANQIALSYIEQYLEQRIEGTQQASRWLSERAASLNEDLRSAEENLQAFLEREQLVDAGGVANLVTREIDELNDQLIDAQRARREAESLFGQIQQLQNQSTDSLLNYPTILNDDSVQRAKQRADEIDRQIAELSQRYGRNHPRMIALSSERENAQVSLSNLVQQFINSIESNYQTALNNENSARAQLEESKSELQTINSSSFERQELEREIETNRQLYEMFFTRIRETQETDDLQSTNATLVDPAMPAIYPSGPARKKTVLLALALGLALGAGLVLLRDMLNGTIKSYSDIENRLQTIALGIVPLIKPTRARRKAKKSGQTGLFESDDLRFQESFRTIRTGVILSTTNSPGKVICVTSSLPGEGKTTVSINLASSLAQMGRRVLLIDTDLRRPSIHKKMGLPENSTGLSDYLVGSNEFQDCIYKLETSGMSIVPAGKHVSDPLELLSAPTFKKLIDTINSRFDHIIFDTPPIHAVSDSLILSQISDAVIFVVKAEATPVKLAKNQLNRLKKVDARVLGVVLNQLNTEKKGADYGGYYDSYGYAATVK